MGGSFRVVSDNTDTGRPTWSLYSTAPLLFKVQAVELINTAAGSK